MTASIHISPLAISLKNQSTSDNFTTTYLHNFLFSSRHWVFCEPAARSISGPKFLHRFRTFLQSLRTVLPDGRYVYRFLDSVRAYLQYRLTSTRRPFTPYNQQSDEHRNIGHALWLLNQAWNTPELPNAQQIADMERWFAESPTLREKYGREFKQSSGSSLVHTSCSADALSPRRRQSDFSASERSEKSA